MKILFFTYDFPYPMTSGGKNRAYHMLKYGKKTDEVILFSFYRSSMNNDYRKALNEIGINTIHTFLRTPKKSISFLAKMLLNPKRSVFYNLYYNPSIASYLRSYVQREEINLVHFESLYPSFYLPSLTGLSNVKLVIGTENIEYKLYYDYSMQIRNNIARMPYIYMTNRIKDEETKLLAQADSTLAVTKDEADYIKSITHKESYIIENGIDIKSVPFSPKEKMSKIITLLFVGNFSYFPNVDAMYYFTSAILPLLPQHVHIKIIGKGVENLSFLTDNRIKKVSYVEDILQEYKLADIFIFPVRIGGGTNFKILESMASGIPIVAIPERVHGLGVTNRKHIFYATKPHDFISAIRELEENSTLREEIIRNARRYVEEKFDWNYIGDKLNTAWHTIYEKS